MTNLIVSENLITILGFSLSGLTIVIAYILGGWGSKRWLLVAIIPGFLSGFLIGISTDIFGFPAGLGTGVVAGVVTLICFVGGGWLTRYYKDSSKVS